MQDLVDGKQETKCMLIRMKKKTTHKADRRPTCTSALDARTICFLVRENTQRRRNDKKNKTTARSKHTKGLPSPFSLHKNFSFCSSSLLLLTVFYPLVFRKSFASFVIFRPLFHGNCASELANCMPPLFPWPHYTKLSTQSQVFREVSTFLMQYLAAGSISTLTSVSSLTSKTPFLLPYCIFPKTNTI